MLFKSEARSPPEQISEKEPAGSEVPTAAATDITETAEPVAEEKSSTVGPENQQDTNERQTEAQENDTEQEVMKRCCVCLVVVVPCDCFSCLLGFCGFWFWCGTW